MCERSRASSSPRWVGFAPTTTAPTSAAASSQKTNSATLSSKHGHVERAVDPLGSEPGRPLGGPRHHLGVGQAQVAGHETEMVVVRSLQDGPGNRLGRRELSPASRALSGGSSAGLTASPNFSDLGWKAHY